MHAQRNLSLPQAEHGQGGSKDDYQFVVALITILAPEGHRNLFLNGPRKLPRWAFCRKIESKEHETAGSQQLKA